MHVVVLGGTGNIGSALVRQLVDERAVTQVTGYARRLPGPAAREPKVTWRALDMAADSFDPVVDGADAVVSLGWLIQPSRDRETTWRTNVVGTARLLDAVSRSNVSTVVVASSVAAYSPGEHTVVDESWPTHGASAAAYAQEKAYVERVLDAFALAEPNRRVVRVRPAFTFQRSSGVQQRRLFLSPWLPNRAVQPQRLPVIPWPRGLTLQVAHAEDIARAISTALVREVDGAYNLASDDVVDAERIGALLDARVVEVPPLVARTGMSAAWRARLTPAPPRLFDALMRLPTMSTARARRELDWRPQYSAADAITAFLRGVREGEGGTTPPLATETGGPAHLSEVSSGVGRQP